MTLPEKEAESFLAHLRWLIKKGKSYIGSLEQLRADIGDDTPRRRETLKFFDKLVAEHAAEFEKSEAEPKPKPEKKEVVDPLHIRHAKRQEDLG